MDLIVDGYNALFVLALLNKEPPEFVHHALRREREYFLTVLSKKRQCEGVTIAVFDGQARKTSKEVKGSLIVVFTARKETADDFILHLTEDKKIKINDHWLFLTDIVVLTRDRGLKQKIKPAKVENPRQFFRQEIGAL